MRDFRKLDVWKQSLSLVKIIYDIASKYPVVEKYGLISQMRRSVVSIPSNIAEGCSRRTSVEFSRFLDLAIGSSFELETQVEISFMVTYISFERHEQLMTELHILQKRLNKLRTSL